MTRLPAADLETVLSFLAEAQAVEETLPFTPELLQRLADLVGCEQAIFFQLDRTSRLVNARIPNTLTPPWDRRTDDEYWTCVRTVELDRRRFAGGPGPLVLANVFSRGLRTSHEFNENARDSGLIDQIHIDLDPARPWSSELVVFGTDDFGDRERLIMELVRPHLVGLFRAARLRTQLASILRLLDPEAAVRLTPREREVMELVAAGRANAEIAETLWITPGTVRKHLENVYAKLGVRSRTAALAKLRG
jgi:DNA-binding CsgD family transcriptional regulator